jgi:hypothetical protein
VFKIEGSNCENRFMEELKNTPCIFTLESSFAGVDIGKESGYHLTT